MRLFGCDACGRTLQFEDRHCLGCGHAVGYLPLGMEMIALDPDGPVWRGPGPSGPWRFCRNWERGGCNWLVPADPDGAAEAWCPACRHNRTVPDLSDPAQLALWQRIETAKRRLL